MTSIDALVSALHSRGLEAEACEVRVVASQSSRLILQAHLTDMRLRAAYAGDNIGALIDWALEDARRY